MRSRRLASVCTLLLICVGAASAQEKKPMPLSKSSATRLLRDALFGSGDSSSEALKSVLNAHEQDHAVIFECLARLPFRAPKTKPKKSFTTDFEAPGSDVQKAPCIFRLPRRYSTSSKSPCPVLFRLHGSGDTAAAFDSNTNDDPAFRDYLLVTPQVPSKDRTAWNEPGGYLMVDAILRHVIESYNVDVDRIYLSGYSAGSSASCMLAQVWPHRIAGIYAMSRYFWACHTQPKPSMDSLKHVPGFFVVGEDDTAERVAGYRDAESYYKEQGLPGVFHFQKGKGHTLMAEYNRKAIEYLAKVKRLRYPKDFNAVFFRYTDREQDEKVTRRCYWLEVIMYDPKGSPTRVVAKGNVIEITGPVTRGSVFLNDFIVNLDEEVELRVNGKTVKREKVDRSVAHLLESYKRDRDPGQLYWNRMDFTE